MSDYSSLEISIDKGIGHILLNNPEGYNKMTTAFWAELPAAVQELDKSGKARVIVLSALGKHFSAGLDLDAATDTVGEDRTKGQVNADFRDKVLTMQHTFTALEDCRVPVIAAIQGACIGGAMSLASACDMRFCSNDAFFSIEEVNIGITCDVGALQRLPSIMSATHMMQWAYTGEKINAQKAEKWGIVGEIYDTQEAMLEAVFELAAVIASKSPLVTRGTKLSMLYARDHSVQDGLNQVATWNAGMLDQQEVMRAIEARMSKKPGDFPDLLERRDVVKGI